MYCCSWGKEQSRNLTRISITEQQSTEAERESNKIKLLEFFEREANREEKNVFDAVIVDVKNHGIFVELLESQAYGLIPISSLRDDLYRLSSDRSSIVGRRDRTRFSNGDTIQVEVAKVDRFKREIDFQLRAPSEQSST